ncbi:cyclase family protein [Actinomadura madurae]|uniref:cyclase family protein n=1 Tax=Actinomadura madurae TaxID=1993 RepID=UPI002026E94E|nr:cyclase family protein [Actinomadura madurae]MCP9951966.1 cyclase family protein [Actinomadura madurae]MCP9968730.1 cyclase family protein [Actinomadura madurae]MCP9981211.1 cyclase family protein [Actinomadura madurae]MCQ0007296.1 cyclase family protein [Actinomadura madurae]MCQ0017403.1 cyclase family protein [Actinomadura madurae]
MSAEKHFPTYAELLARTDAPAGSAWGLFGPDDELGTLNHLTPERVREAVGVVRTGEVVNLNLPLETFDPPVSPFRKSLQHNIYANNPSHRDEYLDSFYPQASTQLDGFRHIGHPEFGFYNGADPDRFQPRDPFLGINRFVEHGIVGRGVLVDVDRFRRAQGRPIDHAAAEAIPITDVADAAAEQGVEFRPGDLLLVRTGWVHHHLYELTPEQRHEAKNPLRASGLLASHDTVAWLWDHRFSLLAADNFGVEEFPAPSDSPFLTEAERRGDVPRTVYSGVMHGVLIGLLGFVLGELWDLDGLAERCARDGKWDCLVVSSPLNLTGGTGSPANAVAIR